VLAVLLVLLVLTVAFLPGLYMHYSIAVEVLVQLAIGVVLGGLGYWFVVRPAFQHDRSGEPWLENHLDVRKRGSRSRARLLCITTADDEAFSWLEGVDALINAPYLLLHRVAFPVTLLGLGLAHWVMRWDFGRNTLEWLQLLLGTSRKARETRIMDAFADFLTWTPPAVTPEYVHLISTRIWEHAAPALLSAAFVGSVVEHYVIFWGLLALLSLGIAFLIRGLAFGSGFGPRAFVACFLTRHKVTLTPLDFQNTELQVQTKSYGLLFHSALHSSWAIGRDIGDWVSRRKRLA